MAAPVSTRGHAELQAACEEGLALLNKLTGVCKLKYNTCAPLSSFYMGACKMVIFTWSAKGGFLAGYRGGHGFALAKLPPAAPNAPPRWSAPLFLSLNVGEVGILMGYEKVESFMVAMTDKTYKRLMEGSHSVLGVDTSYVAFQTQVENKSDMIATSNLDADLLCISHSSGFMVDFSLATGSLSANSSKNRQMYGEVPTGSILSGAVPPPAELEPLYHQLNLLVESGKSPVSPSRVSASLERMTAGYDPDRRILPTPATA